MDSKCINYVFNVKINLRRNVELILLFDRFILSNIDNIKIYIYSNRYQYKKESKNRLINFI